MSAKPLKIRWTHHRDYFKLVMDSYSRIQKLKREHDEFQHSLRGKKMSDDDVDVPRRKTTQSANLLLS